MSFTDEDLKRLKWQIENSTLDNPRVRRVYILALLARLEAAEACINDIEANDPWHYRKHFKMWRKSAGK